MLQKWNLLFVNITLLTLCCVCSSLQAESSIPSEFAGANWVTADCSNGMPVFRKTFELKQNVENVTSATMSICGLGFYQLDVNGQTVSAPMSPGWTNYDKSCLYNRWDVKPTLQTGSNTLGVWLGNGYYNVKGGRYVKYTRSFGQPQWIAKLDIQFADGSTQTLVSDTSWKTTLGPIRFSCIYGGEDWTISKTLDGWNCNGFVDFAWSEAVLSPNPPKGELRLQTHPDIMVAEVLKPELVTVRQSDGQIEANFGYNFSGRPQLTVFGKPGKSITVTLAETKNNPWRGHSYTFTFADDFDTSTNPVVLVPHFTYWGFQYMYISGATLDANSSNLPIIKTIEAQFTTTSSARVGEFHSTAPWLNDIEAMINRSVRSNLQHTITDCPHREKLGWLEVMHLMGPSFMYRYDIHQLYCKICQDVTEAQLPSGMVPDIAPEYTRFSAGFFESPEWSSSTVQLPWWVYKFYGDKELLTRQWETMEKYMTYFASTRDAQGLAKAGLGDWYDWSEQRSHVGYSQHTPGELTATAFLINDAQLMSKIAVILGKPDRAEFYNRLADEVTQSFLKAYYNPETGIVARDSQAGYAFVLAFDLIPESGRPKVVERLIASIERENFRPTTGEVSFTYLLRTLTRENRGDVIAKILIRKSAPGYVNMLENFGMKTLSETWDKPGSSMNHCMFGHAQEWFTSGLLGIQQTENSTAFREIYLCPQPSAQITDAGGWFDSESGRITSDWKCENGWFVWKFTIPTNTTAVVSVPVTDERSEVQFTGDNTYQSKYELGRRIYRLNPGEYEVKAQFVP